MTTNLYRSNQTMINSGTFWRCKHGYTQFIDTICWRCALAAPVAFWQRKFPRKMAQPRAWWVINRSGQRTIRPKVSLSIHGRSKIDGGFLMQGVYTFDDTPAENARLEGLAKSIAKATGFPVADERQTPWNVPRDGMEPLTKPDMIPVSKDPATQAQVRAVILGRDGKAAARVAALEAALGLATAILERQEPPDARAMSDEFVALACVLADQPDEDGRIMECIRSAMARIESLPPAERPEITVS